MPLPAGDVRWVDAAEARELGEDGKLAPLPNDLASELTTNLTERSYAAFEHGGRHWGVPLAASWLGLTVNPDALPAGERGAPPLLDDWLAQLRRVKETAPAGGGPSVAPLWVAWDEPGCADTFALFVTAMGGRLLNDRGLPAFADEGDAGKRAIELMLRLWKEGFVPRNALQTSAGDMPATLEKGHAYWIAWSDVLETALGGEQRPALLRRLGQLQPSAFPVDAKVYSYESRPAVLIVRYRGLAVAASGPGAAWRLTQFITHPLVLDSSSQLTTVLRSPAPPSGTFAAHSRALLAKERQLATWELSPTQRVTLGRFLQAALKNVLPPDEALTRAARELGAPAPPPAPAAGGQPGLTPPDAAPTVPGIAEPPTTGAAPVPPSGAEPALPLPGGAPGSAQGLAPSPAVTPGTGPPGAGSPPAWRGVPFR
jgi:ABC-type glycerol-3-phosphate transport system substrate-binding protein